MDEVIACLPAGTQLSQAYNDAIIDGIAWIIKTKTRPVLGRVFCTPPKRSNFSRMSGNGLVSSDASNDSSRAPPGRGSSSLARTTPLPSAAYFRHWDRSRQS